MTTTRLLQSLACAVLVLFVPSARADIIEGINFPQGRLSFADRVALYSPGTGALPPYNDPAAALGLPDGDGPNAVALGDRGTLTLEFTDNLLVDQDAVQDGLDLYIFERGPAAEPFSVGISRDGITFINVGTVMGQPLGIDISPFVDAGDAFRFVRLVDAGAGLSGSPFAGADIDSVGAIGSQIAGAVPEPGSLVLLGTAALALWLYRRHALRGLPGPPR